MKRPVITTHEHDALSILYYAGGNSTRIIFYCKLDTINSTSVLRIVHHSGNYALVIHSLQ